MKKIKYLLFALLLLPLGIFLGACGQGARYTINFIVDNEIYHSETIENIEELKIPENPAKDGYLFDGWYLDDQTFETLLSKDLELKEDLNVYAKWTVCEHSNIVQDALRPATWTNNGLTAGSHCGDCGHVIVQQTTIVSPQISFTNETFTYDGEEHSIYISGDLPANVSVEYTNNSKTNGGTYDVVASFTSLDGYYNLSDLHATMTIADAEVTNVTSLSMNNGVLSWDDCSPYGYKIILNGQETTQRDNQFEGFLTDDYNSVKVASIFQDGSVGEYVELNDFVVNAPVSNIHFTDDGTTVQFTWESPNNLYDYVFMINGVKTTIDKSQHLYNVQRAQLKANDKIGIYVVGVESLNYFDSKIEELTLQQLDSPEAIINKLDIEWGTVLDAESYVYKVGKQNSVTTTENSFSFDGIDAGQYTIFLTAHSADMLCSEQSSITFTKLIKPTISIDSGIVSWDAIVGQLRYCTKIGEEISSFASHQFELQNRNTQYYALLYAESRASNIMQSDYVYIENDVLQENVYTAYYGTYINGTKTITNVENDSERTTLYIPLEYDGDNSISYAGFTNIDTLYISFIPSTLIKNNIVNVNYVYGVTNIENYSCSGCFMLNNVTIPTSVTNIGSGAFSGCSNLTTITIPDSVESIGLGAFAGCSGLTSIVLPFVGGSVATVTPQSSSLFGHIFGTSSYDGGEGVRQHFGTDSNKYSTFYIPTALRRVQINGGRLLYGAFCNCTMITEISILNNMTDIPDSAFASCINLKNITIPNSVITIQKNAFYNTGLKKINLPTSLERIEGLAFNASKLEDIIIPNRVISIGQKAFWRSGDLTEITIPNSVISIGNGAFDGCTGLTKVNTTSIAGWCQIAFDGALSNPLYYAHHLYLNDEEITELIIPNVEIEIRDYAFYNCTGLVSVVISDNVIGIGNYAYYMCTNLMSIFIGNGVETIGADAFHGCEGIQSIVLGDGIKNIGRDAFNGCRGLTELIIPNGVISIESGVFAGCTSLTSITLPFVGSDLNATTASLSTVFGYIFGQTAYDGGVCVGQRNPSSGVLYNYYIPANLRSVSVTGGKIFQYAFYNCSMITDIMITGEVKSIGSSVFSGCTGLTSVIINSAVESIGSSVFSGCTELNIATIGMTGAGMFFGCKNLSQVVLLNGIKDISDGAFSECTGLIEISLPNSVESIGDHAFSGCTGLSEIVIPESVENISQYAFSGCTGLTEIKLSNNVEVIGAYAFSGCEGRVFCEFTSGPNGWNTRWNYDSKTGNENEDLVVYWYSENQPAESGNYWHYDEDGETILIWE